VHLIDGNRAVVAVVARPVRHPVAVTPFVGEVVDDGGGRRRVFGAESERVGPERFSAEVALDGELVAVTFGSARDEALPDPGAFEVGERTGGPVPAVEVAGDAHRTCVGSPNGERHPGLALLLDEVRSQVVIEAGVGAFVEEVEVVRAEERTRFGGLAFGGMVPSEDGGQSSTAISMSSRMPRSGISTQAGRLSRS